MPVPQGIRGACRGLEKASPLPLQAGLLAHVNGFGDDAVIFNHYPALLAEHRLLQNVPLEEKCNRHTPDASI